MSKLLPAPAAALLIALPVLPLLAGCGLEDYEQRMQRSQARLDRHDELSRKLGPPLELPPRLADAQPEEKGGAPGLAMFYRPPREIQPTCANPDAPTGGLLHHYPNPREAGKDVAAAGGGALTDLYLALAREDARTTFKSFVEDVLRSFPRTQEGVVEQQRQVQPPEGQPRVFTYRGFTDGKSSYAAYFLERDRTFVALVFRLEGKAPAALTPVLELSLQTLALGEDAARAREAAGKVEGLLAPTPAPPQPGP